MKQVDLTELIPGVHLFRYNNQRNWFIRVYLKEQRRYFRKTTGIDDFDAAKREVLTNLSEWISVKPLETMKGEKLISLLVEYNEYQRTRCEIGEIADSSFYWYERMCKAMSAWFMSNGYRYITQMKRTTLKNYASSRVKEGLKINSANQEVTFIRSFFTWLQKEGKHDVTMDIPKLRNARDEQLHNPPFKSEDLKAIRQSMKINAEEASTKFSKYQERMFELYVETLLSSAMRPHEALKLTWKDVKIGQTQTNRKRIVNTVDVPSETKTHERITIFQTDALIRLKELQKKYLGTVSDDWYVFRSFEGNRPQDQSTFRRYWIKIQKQLGISYRIYSCRSHRITEMVLADIPVNLISRNVGTSVKQIQDVYLRYAPESEMRTLLKTRDDEAMMVKYFESS